MKIIKKVFCEILADLGLKITAQSNLKVVNYQTSGKHDPYRRADKNPLYIVQR